MMTLGSEASFFVRDFIIREKLPSTYEDTVNHYYAPLAQRIRSIVRQAGKVPVIGINGAQGTGKSTCAACVAGLLEQQGLRVLVLSIDDLYFPKTVRRKLADEVHPLLRTRGVPGTHDMNLFHNLVSTARGTASHPITFIPRFDKASDDRSANGTPFPAGGIDVILFEGWCIGARGQESADLAAPCNALEQEHDPDAGWRNYINEQLSGVYAEGFESLDYLVMLKAPDFEKIYAWRGEQEEKLRQRLKDQDLSGTEVMDEQQLVYFISHYERLTRWMLKEMPDRADEVFFISDDHEVYAHTRNHKAPTRYLISTDLDATLLDEAYSWKAAHPALKRLAQVNAPLILNSSKTVSEMLELARELTMVCGLMPAPLIAENGGVLAIPNAEGSEYQIEHIGISRETILEITHRLRRDEGFIFSGFSDMTDEDVMEHTGLALEAAKQAKDRQATEPILWNDSIDRWNTFSKALAHEGIRAVKGGRFIHLMGATDKADGMGAALSYFKAQDAASFWRVVALGDSPNDLGMLNAADIAVVIHNSSHHETLQPSAMQCVFPEGEGPVAWNEAVLSIIENSI